MHPLKVQAVYQVETCGEGAFAEALVADKGKREADLNQEGGELPYRSRIPEEHHEGTVNKAVF